MCNFVPTSVRVLDRKLAFLFSDNSTLFARNLMTKNIRRFLTAAALAGCCMSCASKDAPTSPPTAESYATRLLKVQQELTELGKYTAPLPDPSGEFRLACACAVIQKPDFRLPPPSPPPSEDALAFDRATAALHVLVQAGKAGRQVVVTAVPKPG